MGLQTEIAELKASIWKQPPDYKETVLWQDDLRFAKQILANLRAVVKEAELTNREIEWYTYHTNFFGKVVRMKGKHFSTERHLLEAQLQAILEAMEG